MKLIIAGSRTITPEMSLLEALLFQFYLVPEEIISGHARGVDSAGEKYALKKFIKLRLFEANWEEFGKRAGILRNKQMAEYADTLLLIWDGKSKGSANMKFEMLKLNKTVFEVILHDEI